MSESEVAWVAGLLEGEGSFFTLNRPDKRPLARVSMGSCDLDVLERLVEYTGLGSILLVRRKNPRPNAKPHWTWTIQRNNDARDLMEAVAPLMLQRRAARIAEVLESTAPATTVYCTLHDVSDPANVFRRKAGSLHCRLCWGDKMRARTTTPRSSDH